MRSPTTSAACGATAGHPAAEAGGLPARITHIAHVGHVARLAHFPHLAADGLTRTKRALAILTGHRLIRR
jgi:hypothetical protein